MDFLDDTEKAFLKGLALILAAILLAVWLTSCAHSMQAKCRHTAVFAALVYGEQYPVRIAVGPGKSANHAQAQAYIDGEWTWLQVRDGPEEGKQERFRPTRYYNLEGFLKRYEALRRHP